MKRLLTTGLVLLAISGATASFAQSKRTYDDDIYSNSKKAKDTKQEEPAETTPQQSERHDAPASQDNGTYSSSDDNYDSRSNSRQYNDEYSDIDNDYYYSSRISRFNYPFYNRPYYSAFYNPYWYDPYWVDPYWGWSPWVRPGFSISFGAGPYWSSYWGWSSWYGCGNFGSYYGYPGYCSPYGGYYSGYWNGYYAGLYNNYGYGRGYRTVTYGPRYSLNGTNNQFAHNAGYRGFHREVPNTTGIRTSEFSAPRSSTFRTTNGGNNNIDRSVRENRAGIETRQPRSNDAPISRDRGDVRAIDNNRTPVEASPRNDRNSQMNAPQEDRRSRGGWFGRSERAEAPAREQRSFSPRSESAPIREQRSFSPRSESAPSRSFGGNSGGQRSFGNGGGGGFHSGGGSHGGGRR